MDTHATPRASGELRLDHEAILRDSLYNADRECKQLISRARSNEAGDLAAAQEGLRELAKLMGQSDQAKDAQWDHPNADRWLRATEAGGDTFKYNRRQLIKASVIIAAELQVSRTFSYERIQPRIFKLLMIANPQVLGYWQGRLRGLISFAAAAATAYGIYFGGSTAPH